LHSTHSLDLGGLDLDFDLPRIWKELAEAGLEPWADLSILQIFGTEAVEPVDRLFEQGGHFETECAVRLAVADPAHAFMPQRI
jgi:hypothetical protein